jgi:hypothetical protein
VHIVHGEASAVRVTTDTSDLEHTAHGEIQEVRQDGWRAALVQRRGQQISPADPRIHHGGVGIDAVNGVQGAGIDDDSRLGLGLPQRGVSLPPHRHLYVVVVRKLDKCADVVDRAWTQHRYWRPLDMEIPSG